MPLFKGSIGKRGVLVKLEICRWLPAILAIKHACRFVLRYWCGEINRIINLKLSSCGISTHGEIPQYRKVIIYCACVFFFFVIPAIQAEYWLVVLQDQRRISEAATATTPHIPGASTNCLQMRFVCTVPSLWPLLLCPAAFEAQLDLQLASTQLSFNQWVMALAISAPGTAVIPPAPASTSTMTVSVSEPAPHPQDQPLGIKPSSPAPSEPFDVTSSKAASPSGHGGAISAPREQKPESATKDPQPTNLQQAVPATAPTEDAQESSGAGRPALAN